MLLRFMIPGEIFLAGHRLEALDVSASFIHKGYAVQLDLPGGDVHELEKVPKYLRFYRTAEGLRIVVSDGQAEARVRPLADLFQVDRHSELLLLMRGIGSRVCRAIRNFAMVPEIPERFAEGLVQAKDVETHLRSWSPETSTDGESWTVLATLRGLAFADLFVLGVSRDIRLPEIAEVKIVFWSDVVEALEDGKEPPPEVEFHTNAIGHLRQNNFRLAVLESIICLEIVLTQFLSKYLTVSKGVPKERLRKFLSPEIGLTARLSGLLNLTLHESYLDDIDFDKMVKVVEWRNHVTHRTGRLPSGIPEDTLRDGILAVLSLSRLLAERRDNVAAGPELRKIAEALKTKGDIYWPQIWLKLGHGIRMDVEFFIERSSREKMDALVQEAAELFKSRDSRFEASEHLTIHFKQIDGRSLAWFMAGSLLMTEEREATKDAGGSAN